ncbi:gp53-like domain-containing protein [Salmonella enterica]|uniref:gp53-like domain-containing protein n=1 Tax=Salmonella enterica TaxID=28901 RepID=UPI0011EA1C0C
MGEITLMPTNDFKPFATGAGANVMSQADWIALAALATGFQSGKASSAQINKAIRQALFISSALAQYTADKSGLDVLDDGNVAGFITKMSAAFGKDFQPLDATLTAIAALTGTADKLAYFNGTDTAALTTLTSAARDFISCLGVAEMRNYLNLGTVAIKNVGTGTGQVPDMSSWTSGSGWVKFPDGTIIQSGTQVVAGSSTASAVPLSVPFTNTNYSLMTSFNGSASLPSGPCGGRANTVVDFVLVNWSSASATISWLAIGK